VKSIGRYLFEVIVIFLGITLSFLFDEWRESKRELKKEKEYYEVLLRDIEIDSIHLTELQKWANFGNERIDSILQKATSRYDNLDKFSMDVCVFYSFKEEQVLLQSFESIKYNGDLGLIRADSVLDKCYKILSDQRNLNEAINKELDSWGSLNEYLKSEYLEITGSCNMFFGGPRSTIPIDDSTVNRFLNDQRIINYYTVMLWWSKNMNSKTQKILDDLSRLKILLKEELQS